MWEDHQDPISSSDFLRHLFSHVEVPGTISPDVVVRHGEWPMLAPCMYDCPYMSCCPCVCERNQRGSHVNEPSSSYSCWTERASFGEGCTQMLGPDYSQMEAVGPRIFEMKYATHIPRINGEIPTTHQATSDYQRLSERLQRYNLSEWKVKGDGNCQFRALSDQLYGSPDHHEFVRQQVINQLKSNAQLYKDYVPMDYDDYLKDQSKDGIWGDHVTLKAAADLYGVKIFLITSFEHTWYIEVLPRKVKSNKVLCLSFWAEVHYNSIILKGDQKPWELLKKKGGLQR